MNSATDLGEQVLRIVQDVERAAVALGPPGNWPPYPEFSMDLLTALVNSTFDKFAVMERLVSDARED